MPKVYDPFSEPAAPAPGSRSISDPFQPGYEKPGVAGEFGKGISSGIDTLQAAGYGAVGQLGAATGIKPVQDFGLEGYKRNTAEAAENAPTIGSISQIDSGGDLALFAAGGLGQLLPFAAASLATGGAGRAIGGRLAGAAGAETGMLAGLGANTIGTESGLIYGDIYEETGRSEPGTALQFGIGAGLLDVLPQARLARKLTGPAARGSLPAEIAKQALGEGVTEGGQTLIERAAVEAVDPTKRALTEEGLDEIASAAAIGAIGGGVLGGGSEAVSRLSQDRDQPVVDPLAEQQAQRTQDIANVTAAAQAPNAGPLTKAVGLNPQAAADAGAAADAAAMAEEGDGAIEKAAGRAPSLDKEFKASQKQQAREEAQRAALEKAFSDFETALAASQPQPPRAALPAPAMQMPDNAAGLIQDQKGDTPAQRTANAAERARRVLGDDSAAQAAQASADRIYADRERETARREAAERSFKTGERPAEIRNPNGDAPWGNALAAAAYRKKLPDADQYEVKRLDKGQFVLARRAEAPAATETKEAANAQQQAPRLAQAGDQRPSADAAGGAADLRADEGRAAGRDGNDAAGAVAGDRAPAPVGDAQPEPAAALTPPAPPAQPAAQEAAADVEAQVPPPEQAPLAQGQGVGGQESPRAADEQRAQDTVESPAAPEEGAAATPAGQDSTTPAADAAPTSATAEKSSPVQPAADIRRPDGKPFPNKLAAGAARAKAGQKDTHDIVEADGGFVLRKKPEGPDPSAITGDEAPTVKAIKEAKQRLFANRRRQEMETWLKPAEREALKREEAAIEQEIRKLRQQSLDEPDATAAPAATPAAEPNSSEAGATSAQVSPAQAGAAEPAAAPAQPAPQQKRSVVVRELPDDMQALIGDYSEDKAPADLPVSDIDVASLPEVKLDENDRGTEYASKMDLSETPPIIIADGKMLDGKHRVFRARQLGVKTLPAIDMTGIATPEMVRQNTIGDLRQTEQAAGPAPEEQPAAQQTPDKERTPREIEREAYTFAVSLADIQAAAAGERAAFDAKAAEALRAAGYEKFAADEGFLSAVYKEARKRQKEAEREKGRDPAIYQAKLAEVQAAANLPEGEHEAFKLGFDHALAGRTKSTITGDSKLAGYEAARAWLKTPEGRAFFEGKRVNKLENTGADLRRWFDKAKKEAEAAGGEWKAVLNTLVKATTRADVFRPDLEGATPGTIRMADYLRDQLRTFKDWLDTPSLIYRYRDESFDDAARRAFEGIFDEERKTQRLADIKKKAAEYLEQMASLSEALSGAKTVAELAARVKQHFYGDAPPATESYWNAKLLPEREKLVDDKSGVYQVSGQSARGTTLDTFLRSEGEETGPADRKKPLTRPRLDRVTRAGRKDYRQGRDVTPQEFKQAFGFADVGFGKWVGAKQDQDHLNYAYDAFMDLADVLGIKPTDISLGGTLHFTIGALGHGKHAAHYQRSQPHPDGGTVPVINVTNTKGDGTVAHEWFHALDYALRAGRNGPQLGAVDSVVRALKARYDKATIDEAIQKFVRGGWYYKGAGMRKDDRMSQARYAIENGSYGRPKDTRYKINADTLGEDYWGNNEELFARAGEAFVYDKLEETANSYLVTDWVADGKVNEKSFRGTPYPQGDERAFFNKLFGALFESIEFTADGPKFREASRVRDLLKQEASDFNEYKEAMLAKLPELMRQQRQQSSGAATDNVSDADRLLADQRRREEQRLALEAAEAAQRPAEVTSDKALSEDELGALFDEAASELRESTQEKPEIPAPGEQVVVDKAPPGGWTAADKVPAKYRKDDTAGRLAAEAAKLGVKGIGEALTGLSKLFGGKGTLRSFPGGIDPDTYAQAKPHFEAALKAFVEAGKTIKDLFKFLIQNFGEGVKPYAIQFAREQGLGTNLAANPQQADNRSQEAPANVPDGQGPARDDRAGDAGQSTADVREPEGERGAGGRDQRSGDDREGVVPGGDRGGAEGSRADAAEDGADGAARAADDAGARGGRDGAGAGARVPERKRDGRNFRAAAGSLKREGSWRATAARNLDIVELVKKLEAEGRQATADEQAQLVKFTGWGASEIAQNLFPQYDAWAKPDWKDLVARRAKLMSDAEKAAAARTTQYAHYTSEDVVRGIWSALEGMGFTGGNILEPGMGVGLFPAAAPESVMEKSRYTGIEYDPFTAKIAKQLFQRENIIEGDFTKTKLPKDFFDAAIGNPPFGKVAIVNDPEYAKQRFALHDYFFAKTIDRVRPGGLVVFVTSRFTMDKASNRARKYLAERADLLGAIRLPQTAFKENAGTEVVTDILFLRKRMPGEAAGGQPWMSATETTIDGKPGGTVNEYFQANPEMVLGTPALAGSMYRANEYTVLPPEQPIEQALAAAIEKLPKSIYTPKADAKAMVQATIERDFNPKSKKEGTLYVSDKGDLMRVDSGSGVGLASQLEKPLTAKEAEWLKDYVGLRDAVKQAQYDQLTDGEWEKSLKALNKAYDAFVKKHGNVRDFTKIEREEKDEETGETKSIVYYRWKNAKLLFLDVESPIVEMLEAIGEDDKISKSNFLKDRTIKKPARPEIKTTKDALMVTLDERGRLDLDFLAGLTGKDRAAVIDELGDLIYEAPSGDWIMADEYLSGDVVTKLEEAEAAADVDAKFQRNVQALIKVQPKPLGPKDITVQLGAGWVPVEIYEEFASDVLGSTISIQHIPASNTWKIEGAGSRQARQQLSDFGTPDRSAVEIFETALMGKDLKITRTVKEEGKTRTFTDQDATAAANEKLKAMKEAFNRWVWQDGKRGERMAALYNRQFNNLAPRKFDGTHLTLPGLSLKYKLYDHQKRAIWRVVQTGNTYLAHAVGAGKTLEMIVAGMEMKRLGLVSKPMYAVPKHMLKQFAAEFLDAYPAANILVADDKNFDKANRGRFVAQAALNNPDAIIITHPAFTKLSVKDESRKRVADRFIGDLEAAIKDESDKFRRKEMEAQLERLERRFEAKAGKAGKDEVIDFEDLGVDFVFVDEAHEFRKLDFISRRGNIKGIDPNGSARALDLFVKIQHLEAQRPGRSAVLASGTPIVNTIAEIYSVMRMMDIGQIEKDGLDHFDVWAHQFGDVRRELEQNAAGQYEFVERFAQFVNVPELMKRVRSFMDVLTSSQLGELVKRPDLDGGQPDLIINPISDRLSDYLQTELAERIETSRKWKPSQSQPHNPDPLIAIISDGRLAAIDMRFVDNTLKDDPESKLSRMLEEIVAKHKEITDRTYTDKETGKPDMIRGGTQIVFSAVGFGEQVAKSRGFDVKGEILKKLTAGGIKRDQIAFMDEHSTDSKKAQLFKDMRSGKIRVLFGSPKNMGTGVNVQKRLSYLHFLSPPWYPADVEQPHGRILRQGNQNKTVGIKWYATKGTYDSTMWQMVARKQKFIEQAFTGDDSVRKLEDVSESSQYEMASALSSGDQRAIQLAGLNADIERLTRLQGAHADEQATYRGRKSSSEFQLKQAREKIVQYEKAAKAVGDYVTEMTVDVGGKTLKDRVEIGEAVRAEMDRVLREWKISGNKIADANKEAPSVEIAKVQGKYPLVVDGEALPSLDGSDELTKSANLTLVLPENIDQEIEQNQRMPSALDPGGLYTRIRNKLNSLQQTLNQERSREAELVSTIDQLKSRIGTPFQFETDLFEKQAEATRLKGELAAETKAKDAEKSAAKKEADEAPELRTEDDAEARAGAEEKPFTYAIPDGMMPQTVREELAATLGKKGVDNLIRAGILKVLATRQELPAELLGFVNKIPGRKLGMYYPKTKTAYIIADEIKPGEAVKTLMHEIGEHYGLESMLGSESYGRLKAEIRTMRRMGNKAVNEAWAKVAKSYKHLKEGDDKFLREVIAHMGEQPDAVNLPLWKRIVQAVRRFLFKQGFIADKLTDEDVVGMVVASLRQTMSKPFRQKGAGDRAPMAKTEAEPLFSLAAAEAPAVMADVRQRIGDLFETKRTFNGWWHKTVGTQYHKAQIDKDFARVFNRGQDYLHDVNRYAISAADAAPEILPRLERMADALKTGASPRDLKPVAEAVFIGTLRDEKVYSDDELRAQFKLNPKQIRLYRQARAAIDRSLDGMAISEMVKLVRSDIDEKTARAAAAGTLEEARATLAAALDGKPELVKQLDQRVFRANQLKEQGYAPLMRFGRYTVYVTGKDGAQLYFGMFEDEAEARKTEREMREQYPDATVRRGVMSEESHKLFKGLSPDTLDLFANAVGMADDEAFQQYLKLAVNNRSALKRLIERKGIEGYNPDLKRVLAQFIMSNSRASSGNLHRGEMMKAVMDIPREKGDVKDEAVRLMGFLQDPQEEAAGLRSLLFFNFLGGSIASAAVNMTQPFTMTLPYLSQWGARRAGAAMTKAMGAVRTRLIQDPALRAAMDRAIKEGVVEPHQIHELQGAAMQANRDWGAAEPAGELGRKAMFAWGRLFSLSEAFNRRLSFAAAFQIGRELSAEQLREAGAADAYEFAAKAVNETQGIYNRGNRPDWARGAVGATLFTFKQYSIGYLEFLKRLPNKQRAMALGVLVLAAGINGLPFMDDIDDLIDTLAENLGISWNSKERRDAFVASVLGQGAADFITNGASGLGFMPIDVQGRLGLQNLLPATGIGLKSREDKAGEVFEALGPAGGLIENVGKGLGKLAAGEPGKALAAALPVALQNAVKGADMAQYGFYRNERGQRVIDTTGTDAAFKAIGFQPKRVAEESRAVQAQQQNIALNRVTESEIADLWAQGVFEKDPTKVERAREKLLAWNRRNPDSPIRVIPNQIQRRVREMQMTRAQRFVKNAPKELRGQVAREISAE